MNEDITFCKNECMVTRCERHPSNIKHPELPHSYAELYRTEYCCLLRGLKSQGKWIPENNRRKSQIFICSECSGIVYYPQNHRDNEPKRCGYDYCPYCRADMRGVQNESNEQTD